MILINNNPELSEAFKSEEVQRFFKKFLQRLEEPYSLKQFLKDGYEKLYEEQMLEFKKSFKVIKKTTEDKSYKEVERIIDGQRFKVGQLVVDLNSSNHEVLPIGRIYENSSGLHIRLDYVMPNGSSITWRDLSSIEPKGYVVKSILNEDDED